MSTVRGGTTPICITYRHVAEKPVLKRSKKFVGWRQMAKNAIGVVAEFIDSVAYDTTETLECGDETAVVHWALEVDDPFGVNPISGLVAVKVPERPPAGVHFEITKIDPSLKRQEAPAQAKGQPAPVKTAPPLGDEQPSLSPIIGRVNGRPEQNEIRARMREALLKGNHFDPEAGPPPE